MFLAVSFYFCLVHVIFSDTTEDIRKCGVLVLIIALGIQRHEGIFKIKVTFGNRVTAMEIGLQF